MEIYKSISLFAIIFCLNINAQTYQNTTATPDAVAENRLGGCGAKAQPGIQMSEITIPLTGTISDPTKITVNLALNATWVGDIIADLVAPNGDAIALIRRIGSTTIDACGNSANFIAGNPLSFNSANTTLISATSPDATNIPVGNYAPTVGTAPYPVHLSPTMATYFNGKSINGNWRLILYDYGTGDLSNIASWQIIVAAGATLKTNETGVFTSEIIVKENPVKDKLLLRLNNNDFKTLNLEIFDASGRLLKHESVPRQATDFEIDASTWSSGLYLLVPIKDGERKQAIKLSKK